MVMIRKAVHDFYEYRMSIFVFPFHSFSCFYFYFFSFALIRVTFRPLGVLKLKCVVCLQRNYLPLKPLVQKQKSNPLWIHCGQPGFTLVSKAQSDLKSVF